MLKQINNLCKKFDIFLFNSLKNTVKYEDIYIYNKNLKMVDKLSKIHNKKLNININNYKNDIIFYIKNNILYLKIKNTIIYRKLRYSVRKIGYKKQKRYNPYC